jgi:PAS domain-containing protein
VRHETAHARSAALDSMSEGIVLFDKDLRLKFINQQLMAARRYPTELACPGASLHDLVRYQAERGDFGRAIYC